MKLLVGITAILLGASGIANATTIAAYNPETPSELKCPKTNDALNTEDSTYTTKSKAPLTSTLTNQLTDEYKKLNASCN